MHATEKRNNKKNINTNPKQNKTTTTTTKTQPKNPQEMLRCNGTLAVSIGLILFRESIKANHEKF